jgi:hypothetical protein
MVRFLGTPLLDRNGTASMRPEEAIQGASKYFGSPNPEIDSSWDEIVGGM